MVLLPVWKLLFLPLVSGMQLISMPLKPTTPFAPWPAEPVWNHEAVSDKLTAKDSSGFVRPPSLRKPQGTPALSRPTSPEADDVELSLLQRLRAALAQRPNVGGQRRPVLEELASDAYQDWETSEDSDGRLRLAQLARSLTESSRLDTFDHRLISLVNTAIPQGQVFVVEPIRSRNRVRLAESQRLVRDEVLGHGGMCIVVAAHTLRPDRHAPGPVFRTMFGGLRSRFRECAGPSCPFRVLRRHHGTSRRGSGSSREDGRDTSLDRSQTAIALRVAFVISRTGREIPEEEARGIVERLASHNVRSLFPGEISPEQLVYRYGFVVPLFTWRIRRRPSRLLTDGRASLLNYMEAVPLMVTDLFGFRGALHKNSVQFLLKRLVQLGAHLAAAGVVHADIKAENILIDSSGQLYMSDFDTAYREGQRVACGDLPSPVFYDPDMAKCILESPDERVELLPVLDTWAIGVTFVDLACGRLPFPGTDPVNVPKNQNLRILASMRTPSQQASPSSARGGSGAVDWTGCTNVPGELRQIVEMMLDPDRRARLDLVNFFRSSSFLGENRLLRLPTNVAWDDLRETAV